MMVSIKTSENLLHRECEKTTTLYEESKFVYSFNMSKRNVNHMQHITLLHTWYMFDVSL